MECRQVNSGEPVRPLYAALTVMMLFLFMTAGPASVGQPDQLAPASQILAQHASHAVDGYGRFCWYAALIWIVMFFMRAPDRRIPRRWYIGTQIGLAVLIWALILLMYLNTSGLPAAAGLLVFFHHRLEFLLYLGVGALLWDILILTRGRRLVFSRR
jgi:hypothetical protein